MTSREDVIKQFENLEALEREEALVTLFEKVYPFHPPMFQWFQRFPSQEYPSVVATPDVCGGAARLVRTRIPVWVLERMRNLGISEIDILRSFPVLRAADLVQAWSYAARNRDEIEKAIRENEED